MTAQGHRTGSVESAMAPRISLKLIYSQNCEQTLLSPADGVGKSFIHDSLSDSTWSMCNQSRLGVIGRSATTDIKQTTPVVVLQLVLVVVVVVLQLVLVVVVVLQLVLVVVVVVVQLVLLVVAKQQ